MTTLARRRFDSGPVDRDFWPAAASVVSAWLEQGGVPIRDTLLLLPQASLLSEARAAFSRNGGWQPHIETADTLAASLGPRRRPSPARWAMTPIPTA